MIVFKKLFKSRWIYICIMLFPLQDIQGLVYNEYINMDNAVKIIKNLDDIISKLPEGRKMLLQDKKKEFDPLISL